MTARLSFFVHLLPQLIPLDALRGGVAVVVDVLRATTVMVRALASGCEAVIPCLEIDEARAIAARLPAGTALLCGERGGLPIPGFDLGNSPDDFTTERCRDKTLVMTTTNGTRAIHVCLEAEEVYVAAFSNLGATARMLRNVLEGECPRPVHIVCAGTAGDVSIEDTLLAGSIYREVKDFLERFAPPGNDAALLAERLPPNDPSSLSHVLRLGRGGQNVLRLGLEHDIDAAAQVDVHPLLARLDRRTSPFRIWKAGH